MKKKMFALLIIMCMMLTSCTDNTTKENAVKKENAMKYASTTPYGKYPELITYTLGKMTGVNNSNMPEGDTYENNAYTRYLREKLNIQNEDVFEVEENGNYNETVSMAISSDNMPDIMAVKDYDTLQMLVENDMIEDLTDAYKTCMGDRIRKIYESYGDKLLGDVTFKGRIMALPGTNIEDGPNFIWLRKDWLDKLHLKEPKTIDDICNIVRKFIEKNPGNSYEKVGMVCSGDIVSDSGGQYQMDTIFAAFNAFPKRWIRGTSGKVVYGSVEPQVKEALGKIRSMYKEGIIDKDFILRGDNNIADLIINGKCGAFFGPWWSSNNPLMAARREDPEAEWMPYLVNTDGDGSISYAEQKPNGYYIVVRKGYEHPEIAVKIISVLFDDFKYGKDEISKYYQLNVDPTARPLAINVDYSDSLLKCYKSLCDTFDGKASVMDLKLLEESYYKSCKRYRESDDPTIEDWAVYTSRITACSLMDNAKKNKVESVFYGETPSMRDNWWKLQEMEKKAFLAIVTGDKPLSYFDTFVKEWYDKGGKDITKEVRIQVNIKEKNRTK